MTDTSLTLFEQKYPAIPRALAGQLAELFNDQYDAGFTRLSIRGFQFALKGAREHVFTEQALRCVIVGEAKTQHCTFYAEAFKADADDIAPTAVWLKGQEIPSVVPGTARVRDAQGRVGYATRQRVALCILQSDGTLSSPVAFDINAMSLFGDDLPASGALSYASFRRFCAAHRILPCQVPVQVVFDRSQSVPVVKFIPGQTPDGLPALFGLEEQNEIFKIAVSAETRELLKINLLPSQDTPTAQPAPAVPEAESVPTPRVAPDPVPAPRAAPHASHKQAPELVLTVPAPAPRAAAAPDPVPAPESVPAPEPESIDSSADADDMLNSLLDAVKR